MSRVTDALAWRGSGFIVSLFLVSRSAEPPDLDFVTSEVSLSSVRNYELERDDRDRDDPYVYEYDLYLEELPVNLEAFLSECLRRACEKGLVAWLGFEGSFDFGHLLTAEVADQTYGVCVAGSLPAIAIDDDILTGTVWPLTLGDARRNLP